VRNDPDISLYTATARVLAVEGRRIVGVLAFADLEKNTTERADF
jgi:hypothetical protein